MSKKDRTYKLTVTIQNDKPTLDLDKIKTSKIPQWGFAPGDKLQFYFKPENTSCTIFYPNQIVALFKEELPRPLSNKSELTFADLPDGTIGSFILKSLQWLHDPECTVSSGY